MTAADTADNESIREGSNLMAFLYVLRKSHRALVGKEEAHRRFSEIKTRAHAGQYVDELMPKLVDARVRHRAERKSAKASG